MSVINELQEKFIKLLDGRKSNTVEISMPHFLYATEEQARAYEQATQANIIYKDNLDKPVRVLLEENINRIISGFSRNVNFIDLGPGEPQKSLFLLEKLSQNYDVDYYPVDVSPFFLDKVARASSEKGIKTYKMLTKFENVSVEIEKNYNYSDASRFVFLGLTFSNFEADYILGVLRGIVRKEDRCVICFQSTDSSDGISSVEPYETKDVDTFCFLPLKTLGFTRSDFEFEVKFKERAVRVIFKPIRDIYYKNIKVLAGREFETSASFRYSVDYIEKKISKYFEIEQVFPSKEKKLYMYMLRRI